MAGEKNKSFADLKRIFQGSIEYIKQELNRALQKDYADEMRFQAAITIATRLRMMLNDEGRNNSLLEQLHLKKKLLFDLTSKESIDIASNLVFSASLLGLQIEKNRLCWIPNEVKLNYFAVGYFDEWWNEIIIDDKGRNTSQVSRRDVVLTLCDKEGGAHVDPDFDEAYYAIQYKNGWRIIENGIEKPTENNPYAESVFVIAKEFLNSIDLYAMLEHYSVREAPSNHNLICVKYQGINPKLKVHRFAFNHDHRLNDLLSLAFDYYREAEYSLIGLRFKRYFDQRNKLFAEALVVDKKRVWPLYYLRTESDARYVLLGDDKGMYKVVNTDEDIFKSGAGKPLESLIEELKAL